jgi:anti-sigma-K factor RskA
MHPMTTPIRIFLMRRNEVAGMDESIHVVEDLPAYALGSLGAEQAGRVADHLMGCHVCRAELKAYQSIADQLPLAVPEAEPSAMVKPQLFDRIRDLGATRRSPSPSWRAPSRPLGVRLGALVGLLMIALLAFSNILLWRKVSQPSFLTGPRGMRAIPLQNAGAAPDASGFVVVGADGQNGVLVVDRLPALDAGHEYQVWLERDEQSTSGAVFSVDENGYRGVRILAPASLLLYTGISITVEPVGGSASPTGEQVLSGSLFN